MSKKVLVLYPKDNYLIALKKCRVTPVTDPVVNADGLLLTGGGDLKGCSYNSSDFNCRDVDLKRDQIEFLYLKKYLQYNKPVFGICRGMQTVNVFLGGTLIKQVENHCQLNGKDRKHLVQNLKGSLLYKIYGERLICNSAHRQAVEKIGKGLTVNSVSLDGVIECLTFDKIILTQFHPERMGDLGLKLFCHFAELL